MMRTQRKEVLLGRFEQILAIFGDSFVFSAINKHFEMLYQTLERVFHQDVQKTKKWVEKRGAAKCFLFHFKVFGYLMKQSFKCLI